MIRKLGRYLAAAVLGFALATSGGSALAKTQPQHQQAAYAGCATCAGPSQYGVVVISGLVPGVTYSAWWDVSRVDDGPAYYHAAQAAVRATDAGQVAVLVDAKAWPGFYYLYVEATDYASYDPAFAVAFCEFYSAP